ncbi:MAG: PIN domain-containing protein [Microcystis aeruginosa PMC 728.11]|jgi:predicted nucleic acid-binding protein|uniref:type II toxin-antitoxin system VapC family toxin n=1 Tax=Microcystis sp. LE19-84.1B TaxID=3016438 RepID=UPI001DA0061A|nr:PIN domain-containing protein [Microcystis sp. LE19-84.1B]MBE5229035.1 PIN domain-containing protein [Microcystis aeruginosa PMC 728.11]MCZ8224776.1 PIN domain-containing protein [Microcystis sp. LE19-84.1B]
MVKILFDTSVLVAAILVKHPQHFPCWSWLEKVKTSQIEGFIITHTLAELFSVISSFPSQPRFSPQITQRLIQENLKEFQIISLTEDDYYQAIENMVNLGFTGGAIYDGLIAYSTLKIEADKILTLNGKHFLRLGDSIADLVEVPS